MNPPPQPSPVSRERQAGEVLPVVELDSEARAAYVRFSNRKVAKTSPVTADGCIITIDFDSIGGVVGIEMIGVHV